MRIRYLFIRDKVTIEKGQMKVRSKSRKLARYI